MRFSTMRTCMITAIVASALFWEVSHAEKILLQTLPVITLHAGKFTKGRRSSPIPQLTCVSGDACHAFRPSVVQCLNHGSDGVDVQWECKAEMDSKYQFSHIQVSCEGYDYPEDPYVLVGSCGLEYGLEYTQAGRQSLYQSKGGAYPGGFSSSQYYNDGYSSSGGLMTYIYLGFIIFLFYQIFRTCTQPQTGGYGESPNGGGPDGTGAPRGYYGGSGTYGNGFSSSCGNSMGGSYPYSSGGGGGFWSGAATGGLLGYLLGGGNRGYGYGYGNRGYYSSGSGWGGSGGFSSFGGGRSGQSSSGTRTASGFGGTSRR
eukprot:Sdes_comp9525_c0_seq1m996